MNKTTENQVQIRTVEPGENCLVKNRFPATLILSLAAFLVSGGGPLLGQPIQTISNAPFIALSMGTVGSLTVDNWSSMGVEGEPLHCGRIGGGSMWWHCRAEDDGLVVFDTFGSTFNTILAVYRRVNLREMEINRVACSDVAAPGQKVSFHASRGSEYWLIVDGLNSERGVIELHWAMGAMPGASNTLLGHVTTQPVMLELQELTGIPSPSIQWLLDSVPISGATNDTWLASQPGLYSVALSNIIGINQIPVHRISAPRRTLSIQLNAQQKTIALHLPEVLEEVLVLERSTNLIHWEPVLWHRPPSPPKEIKYSTADGACYYRARNQ